MILIKLLCFTFLFFISASVIKAQTGWTSVTSFGSNTGNLNMYSYAPTTLPANAPLVIVLHGCSQTASQYATESGWNILANQHQFYTVYPEQNTANNSSRCFNWFNYADQNKGQGEVLSIKQMIDYMTSNYSIDANRIYITGLSAGACMTNVMLACYPELISGGAVMAGTAFKSSTNAFTASNAMNGFVTHSATAWGDSVRNQNPTYTGSYPKVALFQGVNDFVVNANNVTEIIKQWTNVHNTDQTYDLSTSSFNGNSSVTKYEYNNSSNTAVVEAYMISGMGHAIAIDVGSCYQQGGTTGTYALDFNFYSSFWAANFFNILQAPSVINGLTTVVANASMVTYSVPVTSGNNYTWAVPAGATIISGQGTNSIAVNFSATSGYVSLTETDAGGCKIGPIKLWVTIGTPTFIDAKNEFIYYNAQSKSLIINNATATINSVKLYSIDGKLLQQWKENETEYHLDNIINKGLYILEYEKDKQLIHQKIIIF